MGEGVIGRVISGFRGAVSRFPLAALFCAAGAAAAWSLVLAEPAPGDLRTALALTFTFAVPLFYALHLYAEAGLPPRLKPAYLYAAGLLLLVPFFMFFAARAGLETGDRYGQWMAAALLAVTFAPFLPGGGNGEFRAYNIGLFLRGGLAAVYTVALAGGVSLGLAAVHALFGLEISDKVFASVWVFAGYLLWPLHFMASSPRVRGEETAPPAAVRTLALFAQYVLLPLAAAYFLILYAYLAKVLFTWEWPQGSVSWLTVSASAAGLLAFLLLYPDEDNPETARIRAVTRGFCLAALPLLLTLFTAVYKRVAQYGVTEHRYLLAALGAWLFGVFVYLLASPRPDLKRVPISAALLALLLSFGPWGAYAVSLSSQSGRLERLLSDNGLLGGGPAARSVRKLPFEARRQLSGVLDYLLRYHGAAAVEKFFPDGLPSAAAGKTLEARDLMTFIGQDYVARWGEGADRRLRAEAAGPALAVSGYAWVARFRAENAERPRPPADGRYRAYLRKDGSAISFFRGNRFFAEVPLASVAEALGGMTGGSVELPQEKLCVPGPGLKACFHDVRAERGKDGALRLDYAAGTLLIK